MTLNEKALEAAAFKLAVLSGMIDNKKEFEANKDLPVVRDFIAKASVMITAYQSTLLSEAPELVGQLKDLRKRHVRHVGAKKQPALSFDTIDIIDVALRFLSLPEPSFQERVKPWMLECFGPEISADINERNHRFLEEALELVQSTGCTKSEAHQLVDYVFGRDVGETKQEVGGVMNTLAALCLANNIDMHDAGEIELARVWTKIEKIRAKRAAKPKHSPLPEHFLPEPSVEVKEQVWRNALEQARETLRSVKSECYEDETDGSDLSSSALHTIKIINEALKGGE